MQAACDLPGAARRMADTADRVLTTRRYVTVTREHKRDAMQLAFGQQVANTLAKWSREGDSASALPLRGLVHPAARQGVEIVSGMQSSTSNPLEGYATSQIRSGDVATVGTAPTRKSVKTALTLSRRCSTCGLTRSDRATLTRS